MPSPLPANAPRFSIVAAVYNVARYLDAFIASIEAQTFPRDRFEVIAVDDGSTDDSLKRLQAWAQSSRPGFVTVLTKSNGGQSSARNLGLEAATGEWVTFTDPDDLIGEEYLSEVDAFLAAHAETHMIATNRHMLNDETGELTDTHPLHALFRGGNRLHYLDTSPTHFHGSAPAAFFRRSLLDEHQVRFDPEVRPNFEDGHFCCRYLFLSERPAVGFLHSAVYQYRKRGDASSTLQTSLTNPDRYTNVLRSGYLALLRAAEAERGRAPDWLQNYVLYELSWYFTSQDTHAGNLSAATGAIGEEFHDLMRQITSMLDPELIRGFSLRWVRPSWRFMMSHAYRDDAWHQSYGLLDRYDPQQGVVRLRYHFTHEHPRELFVADGQRVEPVAAKTRSITYHGRSLLFERIAWVPLRGDLRVRLDDDWLDLAPHNLRNPAFALDSRVIRSALDRRSVSKPRPARAGKKATGSTLDRLTLWLADRGPVRRMFSKAWVLMDRVHTADDSAEILFRYLRKKRRKINAWFVVEAGTADYRRLREAGYRRIVAHGTLLWKLLMLNCHHLISSHADRPVVEPPEITRLRRPGWRFTFLQHGVIKDDLSAWLNPKPIDIFVVSTPQEAASIAGDGNDYVFTSKEVQLTGLPRFDRLRRVGSKVPPESRDLILVTPTWRQWLLPPLKKGSQRRTLQPEFFSSEFAQQWFGLLRSPELAALCTEQGLRIGFLPHPNLAQVLDDLDLPDHVVGLSYEGHDVQEYFARAAVVVTDYSSIAFNAAYLDRPVLYFQFDEDRVLGGGHVGRRGYFDYRRDGFGPVTTTLEEAEIGVSHVVRAGRSPLPEYQDRIAATFPRRDGKCCQRVTNAILASTRRTKARTEPTALPEGVGPKQPIAVHADQR